MTTEHNRPMPSEDQIDAALTILREMQPPSEMVSRVHRSLETAAMSQGGELRGEGYGSRRLRWRQPPSLWS
jgi:hypothetical protein